MEFKYSEVLLHTFFFQQANQEGILKNANVIKVNGFNRVNSLGWVVWIGGF